MHVIFVILQHVVIIVVHAIVRRPVLTALLDITLMLEYAQVCNLKLLPIAGLSLFQKYLTLLPSCTMSPQIN